MRTERGGRPRLLGVWRHSGGGVPAPQLLPLGEEVSGRLAPQAGHGRLLFLGGHLGCGGSLLLLADCPLTLPIWTKCLAFAEKGNYL